MTETRVKSDTVYSHERYGEVLVTGIGKMYEAWDADGPQEDIESGEVLVFFYDDYDGYGGMSPVPNSEPVNEFVKQSEAMEDRDYESIDPEEYTKDE